MDRPTIEINGETIKLAKTTVHTLREVLKLDAERRELSMIDFLDRSCEVLALAFGVTPEQVYDTLDVEELMPKYIEVLTYLLERLSGKSKKKDTVDTSGQT